MPSSSNLIFPTIMFQSKGSLEITESQSADAEPPPPPKPDLSRYTGLRTHLSLATNEGTCYFDHEILELEGWCEKVIL